MNFIKIEVEGDERRVADFGLVKNYDDRSFRKGKGYTDACKHLPNTATLLASSSKQVLRKKMRFLQGKASAFRMFFSAKEEFY